MNSDTPIRYITKAIGIVLLAPLILAFIAIRLLTDLLAILCGRSDLVKEALAIERKHCRRKG